MRPMTDYVRTADAVEHCYQYDVAGAPVSPGWAAVEQGRIEQGGAGPGRIVFWAPFICSVALRGLSAIYSKSVCDYFVHS